MSSFAGSQLLISRALGTESSPPPHAYKQQVCSCFTSTVTRDGPRSPKELGSSLSLPYVWLTCSRGGWRGRQVRGQVWHTTIRHQ